MPSAPVPIPSQVGHCIVCGERLPPGQQEVCHRPHCRFVHSRKAVLSAFAFGRFLREQSELIRAKDRESARLREEEVSARERERTQDHEHWQAWLEASYPMVAVPHNGRRLRPLSARVKTEFRAHLEKTLEKALAQREQGMETDDGYPLAPSPARALLGAACACCAGACCLGGSKDAYLTEATLLRVMRKHPELTPEALGDLYLSFLPEKHYGGGCIYHGKLGCALPPDMRAIICHSYFCASLNSFKEAFDPERPPAGLVVIVRDREHWSFPEGADRGILKTCLATTQGTRMLYRKPRRA